MNLSSRLIYTNVRSNNLQFLHNQHSKNSIMLKKYFRVKNMRRRFSYMSLYVTAFILEKIQRHIIIAEDLPYTFPKVTLLKIYDLLNVSKYFVISYVIYRWFLKESFQMKSSKINWNCKNLRYGPLRLTYLTLGVFLFAICFFAFIHQFDVASWNTRNQYCMSKCILSIEKDTVLVVKGKDPKSINKINAAHVNTALNDVRAHNIFP